MAIEFWYDWILWIISIAGFFLSLINLYLRYKENRITPTLIARREYEHDMEHPIRIILSIGNGSKPLRVVMVGIKSSKNVFSLNPYSIENRLPNNLEPWMNYELRFQVEILKNIFNTKKIKEDSHFKIFIVDSFENYYFSDKTSLFKEK